MCKPTFKHKSPKALVKDYISGNIDLRLYNKEWKRHMSYWDKTGAYRTLDLLKLAEFQIKENELKGHNVQKFD